MNRKQRESLAKYCYDMSKAVHVGWMIGVATGEIPWWHAMILFVLGMDLFILAFKQEVFDE
ncbi:MAG: hypothetical protein R8K47_03335 [Mariprofundaceae bacterium]